MRVGGGSARKWAGVLLLFLVAAVSFFVLSASPQHASADDAQELAFLGIINQYRAANGLGALSVNSQLDSAAHWKANDMATNNYFSHTDSLGRDPFTMMCAFGYCYNTYKGENLLAGAADAQTAFNYWKNSPGHNANMLGAGYTVIGIGRAYNAASGYGWYWATEFGGYPPASAPAPPPPPAPQPTPRPYVPPPPAPPTPEPTPVPTPVPTPEPTPVPTPPPTPTPLPSVSQGGWWRVVRAMQPFWNELSGEEPLPLPGPASYLVDKYSGFQYPGMFGGGY